jgi:hypothetical protein
MMQAVRTTVTLDPDSEALIRKLMDKRGLSFKEAVNQAIRAGLAPRPRGKDFRTPTFRMGPSKVPLDRALGLAGELEDAETARKLSTRK